MSTFEILISWKESHYIGHDYTAAYADNWSGGLQDIGGERQKASQPCVKLCEPMQTSSRLLEKAQLCHILGYLLG